MITDNDGHDHDDDDCQVADMLPSSDCSNTSPISNDHAQHETQLEDDQSSNSSTQDSQNDTTATNANPLVDAPTESNDYLPPNYYLHTRNPSGASSIPHLMKQLSISTDSQQQHHGMVMPSSSLENVSSLASSHESTENAAAWALSPRVETCHKRFEFHHDSSVNGNRLNKNHPVVVHRGETPPHNLGMLAVCSSQNEVVSPPHKVQLHGREIVGRFAPATSEELSSLRGTHIGDDDVPTTSSTQDTGHETPSQITNVYKGEGQPQPIPKHDKPHRQPVLYSAINSLERYNEGSFDNKLLYAKAFSKKKDFPGVPSRDRSVMKQDNVSTMSEVMTNANDATDEHDVHLRLDVKASREEKSEETLQHHEPINKESSLRPVVRSKSSSNLSEGSTSTRNKESKPIQKEVTILEPTTKPKRRRKRKEKTINVFRPTGDAYTPRMSGHPLKYKPTQERESVDKMSSTMGTIQRPNFRDALRRVAIILHQHIVKIERRFETGIKGVDDTGLFKTSKRDEFSEDRFATPRYKCSMVRVPMACPGVVYSMRKLRVVYRTPSTDEIYDFAHQLFKKVQLSSECSIVCLIYVEKLMEVAKVPLVASTWRPIFMCGLLLASKVWQDLSSWNIEFASVYPQFSLEAINRLEVQFLKAIKWDLYISSR